MSVVAREYGLSVSSSEYLPVGYGAYHWKVVSADGTRYFLTVDDLRTKSWFGPSADDTFVGLSNAYSVARDLVRQGLPFVVAARETNTGAVLCRLSDSYALSLTEFLDGVSPGFGATVPPEQNAQLQRVLARLHSTTAPLGIRVEDPHDVVTEVRDGLAGVDVDEVGPYAAPLRDWFADKGTELHQAMTRLAALANACTPAEFVVTHGEPHWGNIMVTNDGLRLVDWDTVGLARPERDLWHISGDPRELDEYEELAAPVQRDGLEFHALAWTLRDVVAFVRQLATARDTDAETAQAWDILTGLTLA